MEVQGSDGSRVLGGAASAQRSEQWWVNSASWDFWDRMWTRLRAKQGAAKGKEGRGLSIDSTGVSLLSLHCISWA